MSPFLCSHSCSNILNNRESRHPSLSRIDSRILPSSVMEIFVYKEYKAIKKETD